uniref:Variant surface glycoprotein (VSG) n=2 Tax=Trypanosoma brucei TaxID=5691 RepID=Q4FKT1_TRYB2|nr:variant surface glycoprotein VSG 10.3 [Trypanosoma brucei]CAJ16308.1 variant surface glycoprotein (VSG) [Trypanosoma brucei brucei TREU927]
MQSKLLAIIGALTTALTARAEYQQCATACECAARIDNAISHYSLKHKANTEAAERLFKNTLRLVVAALTQSGNAAKQVIPALAAAGPILEACYARVRTGGITVTEQLPALANASAKLKAMARRATIKTEMQLTPSTTDGYLRQTSIPPSPTITQDKATCTTPVNRDRTDFDPNKQDQNVMPELPEYIHTGVYCKQTDDTNNCHSGAAKHTSASLKFYTWSAPEQDTSKPSSNYASSQAQLEVVISAAVNITQGVAEQTKAALGRLQSDLSGDECNEAITSYSSVSSQPAFKRQAIRTLLGKPENEAETTEPTSELTDKLKANYGESGNEYNKNLWKEIEQLKIDITKSKTKTKLDLKEERTISELTEGLARRIGELNAQAAKATKNDDKSANDTSKSDAAEDKAGKRKDGDNKTNTNTTGSNSFVINKAPLFLAFLLF